MHAFMTFAKYIIVQENCKIKYLAKPIIHMESPGQVL